MTIPYDQKLREEFRKFVEEKYNDYTHNNISDRDADNLSKFWLQKHNEFVEEVRKEIRLIDEKIAVTDNDGHRYEIPESKKETWYKWIEIPEDNEDSWDVPDWAERIDGLQVESLRETILSLPQLAPISDTKRVSVSFQALCTECDHEICPTCKLGCHNSDCPKMSKPMKSCFDFLLTKK